MQQDHEHFMRVAIDEALKGEAEGNAPIGSIVVRDAQVVASGRNLSYTTMDPTAHAEIVAVRNAGPVLNSLDLSGCQLYTTMAPCAMCCTAAVASGADTIVIGARSASANPLWRNYSVERFLEFMNWTDKVKIIDGILPEECDQLRLAWEAKKSR